MTVSPDQINWQVHRPGVGGAIDEQRAALGDDAYREDVAALRELLAHYFSLAGGCTTALGKSIRPCGGTPSGGKAIKVRWGTPGSGKSGGYRLGFAVHCEERRVVFGYAERRSEDPTPAELSEALREAEERFKPRP